MKKINTSHIIFLTIILAYILLDIIFWVTNNPIIPQGEAVHHFNDIFDNHLLYYNAPLITWIMKGMFSIFGKEYFDLQIIFVNFIFFLTALYFLYKIGLEIKDKTTGNIAMILFALTPCVYGLSRQFGHQDWHVMIALIPNIYCLIKTKNFEDTKWSIFYGISVGIGLLIKDEFLAYFFTPYLYVAAKNLLKNNLRKTIINILIPIISGILIAGCHYLRFDIIRKIIFEPVTETVSVFSFNNIYLLTMGISEYLLSPPLFTLLIISLIYFIVKFKNKNKCILILWFLIPWLILFFMGHRKEPEYMLGCIPALILICSIFISQIKNLLLRQFVLFSIIIICLLQFIMFFLKTEPQIFNFETNLYNRSINYFKIYSDDIFHPSFITYKKCKCLLPLTNYIKSNFNNTNSIFIYHFSWDIYYEGISVFLKLNNFNNIFTEFDKIKESDIVIYTSNCILTDEKNINEIEKTVLDEHIHQYNNNNLNYINSTINYLKNNYIEVYNLYDIDTNTYIYVLCKKDLYR